ncbi:basic proline-rich protein-like [Camelus ferus]|uniref:Basic proline-rich protein-like n=1 Tax=Camelus ferus TaxID=419612 RepID=A0A8B8SZI3_CAMFR|nr:basic proline-rich protein-like [Camelus ferus]
MRASTPPAARAPAWGTRREANLGSRVAGWARFPSKEGEAVPGQELDPGMPKIPNPPALVGKDAAPAYPSEAPLRVPTAGARPSPPGGPRLGGSQQRAQPGRRPHPEPHGPQPFPPPFAGRQDPRAAGPSRAPQETAHPAPARNGRSPDVPAAPARAHPAPSRAAEPLRPAQPLPEVPGGRGALHGRCPESPEPGRALGAGSGASLTAQWLRAAPGPRGAPGIFFWETSPLSVGLSRSGRKSIQRREAATIRELRWDVNPPPRLPSRPPPPPPRGPATCGRAARPPPALSPSLCAPCPRCRVLGLCAPRPLGPRRAWQEWDGMDLSSATHVLKHGSINSKHLEKAEALLHCQGCY